jgi:glycosyltransferase 2 family protein
MSTTVVSVDGHQPPVVIDEPPVARRSRRPLDAARLALTLAATVVVVLVAVTAERTVAGIEGDLTEASSLVPTWLLLPLSAVAAFATLGLWIGYVGLEMYLRRRRTAGEMVLAGVTAIVLLGGLSLFLRSDAAPDGLAAAFAPPTSTGNVFPAGAGATVALVSVVGWTERPWVQRLALLAIGGGVIDLLLTGQTTPQGAAVGLLVGRAIGLSVRLVFGVPTQRPDGTTIASALLAHAVPVRALAARDDAWPRTYRVSTPEETLDLVVLDRDREGTGLLGSAWRWLRLRGDILPRETLTMRGGTDARALNAYALEHAGVRSPALRACFAVGADAIALLYERSPGTPIGDLMDDSPLTEDVLLDLWQQLLCLRRAGIAHRNLSPLTLTLDPDGRVWIIDQPSATVAASEPAMLVDVAQILVLTSAAVGPKQAVKTAIRVLGRDTVGAALPLVQPLALPPSTRALLGTSSDLLERVRDQVRERAEPVAVESVSLERVRPRALLSGLSILLAVYLVGSNLVGVDILGTVAGADPFWLLVALLAAAATYLGASWGLIGFVPEHVPLGRTVMTQLALAFVRLAAPTTIAIAAVNTRMLMKLGITLPKAAASVAASQAAAFLVSVPLIVVLGIISGREVAIGIQWSTVLVAVGVVALTASVVLWLVPAVRTRALASWRSFIERGLPRLLDAVQDPRRLAMGLGGNLLLTLGYGVALYACVVAVGAEVSIATAALVYVSGNAVGSIVPTPGGLGAVEAALTAGLTAAGVPAGQAFSAVLLFRLATFWLPIPLGWVAWNRLQRANAL